MDKNPTNIIYIVSSAHSGSTLLDLILGSHSAIQSGGEFYKFPMKSKIEDGISQPCSCGEKIIDCDFWQRVLEGANLDFEAIQSSQDFFSLYDRMIPSMLKVAGKSHFVDSSKRLTRLKKYLKSDQFRVSIIHLVRDPRAVAYSFVRKKKRVLANQEMFSSRVNPPKYLQSLWLILRGNMRYIVEMSKQKGFHTVKYEDLVVNPQQALSGFLERIHLPFEDSMVHYYDHAHHVIGGNRMRFQKRPLALDKEYLHNLSAFEWFAGTCISLPILLKYKYPLYRRI